MAWRLRCLSRGRLQQVLRIAVWRSVCMPGREMINRTHDVGGVFKINVLFFHSTKDDLESMQQVLENGDLPLLPVCDGEAFVMDEAHLLDHR